MRLGTDPCHPGSIWSGDPYAFFTVSWLWHPYAYNYVYLYTVYVHIHTGTGTCMHRYDNGYNVGVISIQAGRTNHLDTVFRFSEVYIELIVCFVVDHALLKKDYFAS